MDLNYSCESLIEFCVCLLLGVGTVLYLNLSTCNRFTFILQWKFLYFLNLGPIFTWVQQIASAGSRRRLALKL